MGLAGSSFSGVLRCSSEGEGGQVAGSLMGKGVLVWASWALLWINLILVLDEYVATESIFLEPLLFLMFPEIMWPAVISWRVFDFMFWRCRETARTDVNEMRDEGIPFPRCAFGKFGCNRVTYCFQDTCLALGYSPLGYSWCHCCLFYLDIAIGKTFHSTVCCCSISQLVIIS